MEKDYRELLINFYETKRRMPSYSEMARLFGFKSKNAVYRLVGKLVEAGVVAKDTLGRLLPGSSFEEASGVKLLGVVEAGIPAPAEEATLEVRSLDRWLVKNRPESFMLTVKGDSMIEAGMYDGDSVIVERTAAAKPGQIVVAFVDDGWTMKYLRKDKEGYYLEPANERYAIIRPTTDFRIAAIVTALVRKYKI